MEEDEDTVLENSPLDRYLQHVSDMDFSKYQTFSEEIHDDDVMDDVIDNDNQSGASLLCSYECISTNDVIKAMAILFECISLSERDRYILNKIEDYTKQELNTIYTEQKTKLKSIYSFLSTYSYYFVAFVVVMVALPTPWLFFFSYYEELYVLIFLLIAGLMYLFFSRKQNDISTSLLKELIEMNENTEHLELLISKSINHIREVDIVMNGYLTTSIHKSFLHKKDNGMKCKKIRKFLHDKLFEVFMIIRSRERILLQTTNFREIDVAKDEYLAELALNVLTDILKKNSEVAADPKVNDLDINSIKEIINLYREQCSEFIYSCILALHSLDTMDSRELKSVFYGISDINKALRTVLNELEKLLETSIDLLFSNHIPVISKSLEISNTENNLFHSAKLNLHSALYRLNEISESYHDENESDTFRNAVNQFNLLVDNAKSCVNDVLSIKKPDNNDNDNNKTIDNNEELSEEIQNDSHIIQEPPQEIGDMLLEGEGNETADVKHDINGFNETKKDTENSRKLMRELKCILSVKESPIGLVPFPLNQSIQSENIADDITEKQEKLTKEKKSNYNATEYYGDDDGINEHLKTNFSLPKNFLEKFANNAKDILQEETFCDEFDDDDTIGGTNVLERLDNTIGGTNIEEEEDTYEGDTVQQSVNK